MKVSKRATAPRKKTVTRKRTAPSGKASPLWKSILVPTDFSPASFKALEYALTLGALSDARVTLAHIVVPVAAPDLVYGPVDWDEGEAMKQAKVRLNEIKHEQGFELSKQIKILVRRGHPYHEIDRIANDIRADLIVVSTHGRTGLRHLLLGSVAERVIRHAPCPVLVVREKEHEFIG